MLETASLSGKTRVGSAVNSVRRAQTVSCVVDVNSNVAPFLRGPLLGVYGEPC